MVSAASMRRLLTELERFSPAVQQEPFANPFARTVLIGAIVAAAHRQPEQAARAEAIIAAHSKRRDVEW